MHSVITNGDKSITAASIVRYAYLKLRGKGTIAPIFLTRDFKWKVEKRRVWKRRFSY